MVVVRESPRTHLSPDKNPAQWPPRSPFQALLSSPSGRKKWHDHRNRAGERSPSPTSVRSRKLQQMVDTASGEGEHEDEDEDEDEEILQLKLEEIKTKLRLKKLQCAKKSGSSSEVGGERGQDGALSASPLKLERKAISPTGLYKAAVEVPVSPAKNPRVLQEQRSPARQRLGLTSVPRAQDVSLKRARDGTHLKRQRCQPSVQSIEALPKPKSFSERLVESKKEAEERQAKKDRLDRLRNSGFNHAGLDISTPSRQHATPTQTTRASRPVTAQRERTPSVVQSSDPSTNENDAGASRSASMCMAKAKEPQASSKSMFNAGAYGQESGTGHAEGDEESTLQVENNEDSGYDPFSKIHLTKRHISHMVVAREMEGKEVYSLPRLLKEVKSPEYDAPDCESDYVVFAVLASKSSPLDHAQTHRTAEEAADDYEAPRNKFMVLHLCDLKWEIDVFLFGTAFTQFWKLTPGTLLAILNPAILPPKGNQHNGRFSLKLGSSEDAVMEIGVARDLGYCSAVKKDGQQCGEWVDRRKTEACEFHISLQVEKSRKGRMEVNTMFHGGGDPNDRNKIRVGRNDRSGKRGSGKYHREYGQLYSVKSGLGKSAASLLDDEDIDALHNMTKEEASRKRIANAQRERDLAKKLGEMGRGPGAEYLRTKHTPTSSSATMTSTTLRGENAAEDARNSLFAKPSAADLGLLGKKATDAHLSPAKDRKKHFGLGAMSMQNKTFNATPMGWGGARTAGLLQPKENRMGSPERGQTKLDDDSRNVGRPRSQQSSMRSNGSSSPVKKKARFALDKGIREPGRESLPGNNATTTVDDNDDDDDDLDIIL